MKALVLAGGYPQIALIKELHDRGYETVLADWSEHPPAEMYADKFYQKSTLDIEAIKAIATEESVDLIITVCTDQALNTVSIVSEMLGLPCYISAKVGKNVTNKWYMKSILETNGIPTAKHCICRIGQSIPSNLSFPMVVKPVDCNSSKGVVRVENYETLERAVTAAQHFSRSNTAIIEQFIDGRELSVDAIVINGVSTILAVSEIQKINDESSFVICRSILPPTNLSYSVVHKISIIAQQIVDAFNLKSCPLLIQLLNKHDELFVVEFSARTGGGEKYKTIQMYSGVDIVSATIDISLGAIPKIVRTQSNKHILSEFIYCYKGTVDRYEGFREAKELGLINNFELFRKHGNTINDVASSADRAASVTFVCNSADELINKYKATVGLLRVIDTTGADIMRHDIVLY